MQQTWPLEGGTRARGASHGWRLLGMPKALAAAMVPLLRRRFARPESALPPPLTGFVRGEAVRLPKGDRIAAEEVEFRPTEFGEEAVAIGPEAWIAIRVSRASIWYALWYDDQQRWELLGV